MTNRFNINDDEVRRCRMRLTEIDTEISIIGAGLGEMSMDHAPVSEVEQLITLTTEIATIRGIQQSHALRCAAEMRVGLNKRSAK
jgi:hypothetical protein